MYELAIPLSNLHIGLIGFMTEQGPFRPVDGGAALKLNEFAWNKVCSFPISAPVMM